MASFVKRLLLFFFSKIRTTFFRISYGSWPLAIESGVDFDIQGDFEIAEGVTVKKGGGLCVERKASLRIGKKFFVGRYAFLKCYGGKVDIGNNVSINAYVFINGAGGLVIGDNVRIGAHSSIIASNHVFSERSKPICEQGISAKGVVIKDDVWIGTGARILDGVTLGQGSIIAAGAIVNKDVSAYSVVGGVPARRISERPN